MIRIAKVELDKLITFDTTKSRGHALARIAPELDSSHEHLALDYDPDKGVLLISEEETGRLIVLVPSTNIVAMQVSADEQIHVRGRDPESRTDELMNLATALGQTAPPPPAPVPDAESKSGKSKK